MPFLRKNVWQQRNGGIRWAAKIKLLRRKLQQQPFFCWHDFLGTWFFAGSKPTFFMFMTPLLKGWPSATIKKTGEHPPISFFRFPPSAFPTPNVSKGQLGENNRSQLKPLLGSCLKRFSLGVVWKLHPNPPPMKSCLPAMKFWIKWKSPVDGHPMTPFFEEAEVEDSDIPQWTHMTRWLGFFHVF